MTDTITGHRTFDKQANHPCYGYIGTGNVVSGVQASNYIRGYQNVSCNGHSFKEGELQNSDLEMFKKSVNPRILNLVRDNFKGKAQGIFYTFFHYKNGHRITHGWMLTDEKHNLIDRGTDGPTYKSHNIMNAMVKKLTSKTSHQQMAILKEESLAA